MDYLKYSYILDVPIDEAFNHIIDIQRIDDNAQIFAGATLTSNGDEPIGVGKKYVVLANSGDSKIETTLTIENIQRPNQIEISYKYKTICSNGVTEEGCILPWESMSCIITFRQLEDKTLIETTMIANGINNLSQLIVARLLSIINWFQQLKANSRVKKYINSLA
jgi:hypothetical protein